MVDRQFGGEVVVAHRAVERARDAVVRRKVALFGVGDDPRLFARGGRPDLIGKSVSRLGPSVRGRLRVALNDPGRFRAVDPPAPTVPAEVDGYLRRGGSGALHQVAVALNGRIVATARTISRDQGEYFAALVPPEAFRRGANRVELFDISAPG